MKRLLLATLGLTLMGSVMSRDASAQDTLEIYTTIYPLEFIVGEIGGDTVDVESIIPPGADAHSYEPTMQDMTSYANADAFIYVGGNMEVFSDTIANALSSQSVELIHLSDHEELFMATTHEHDHDDHNHDDHNHDDHDHDHEDHEHDETVVVEGIADHYHTGDELELSVSSDETFDSVEWYTLSDDEWSLASEEETFTASTDGIDSVRVSLLNEGEVVAESAEYDIVIDDHEHEHDHDDHEHEDEDHEHEHDDEDHEHDETVTIDGIAHHYHSGDELELSVSSDETFDSVEWYTLSDDEWSLASEEETFTASTDGIDSVRVSLLNEGEVVAESAEYDIVIDDHDTKDPHIWISPTRMIDVADIIKDEMIALAPENEELYIENYEQLVKELEELDAAFTETLADKENAHIIVPHAAYGYWEQYGVTQIPLSGYSMSEEPSQRQLQELVNTANEYNLEYVLFEQNTDSRIPEVIQNEIDAEARTIHNLEVRLEEEVQNSENYFDIMYRNLEVLDEVTY